MQLALACTNQESRISKTHSFHHQLVGTYRHPNMTQAKRIKSTKSHSQEFSIPKAMLEYNQGVYAGPSKFQYQQKWHRKRKLAYVLSNLLNETFMFYLENLVRLCIMEQKPACMQTSKLPIFICIWQLSEPINKWKRSQQAQYLMSMLVSTRNNLQTMFQKDRPITIQGKFSSILSRMFFRQRHPVEQTDGTNLKS